MATVLYRVGAWCARHAKLVVVLWLVAFMAAGTAAALFAKGATSQYSVPDAPYQRVLDDLDDRMPGATKGSGTVVLHTDDDSAFTRSQQRQIGRALEGELSRLDTVAGVTDPFTTQRTLDDARAEVASGGERLEKGREDLRAAQQRLDEQRSRLEASEKRLDESLSEMPGNPSREQAEAMSPQLGDRIRQLEQGREQLDHGQQRVDDSRRELDSRAQGLEDARTRTELSSAQRFVTEDGTVARGVVSFAVDPLSMSTRQRDEIVDALDGALPEGVTAEYSVEITQDVSGLVGSTEVIGIVVAGIVLLLVLGSIVMAGLPVLSALIGCGTGVALVYALTSVVEMTATDPVLALMLGMGLGIDYALLITHRHRINAINGMPLRESVARATGTAGTSVLFAGLTNVVALSALATVGIPFLGTMGLAGAGTVMLVIVSSVMVTPALLSLMGHRVHTAATWRRHGFTSRGEELPVAVDGERATSADGNAGARVSRARAMAERIERQVRLGSGTAPGGVEAHTARSAHERMVREAEHGWGAWVTRHPVLMIAVAVILLGVMALPASHLRLGLPDGASEAPGSSANTAYRLTSEHFGEGANAPILAMVTLDVGSPGEQDLQHATLQVAQRIADLDHVSTAVPASTGEDHRTALITVVPDGGPSDVSTTDLVHTLRDQRADLTHGTGADVGFTGQTVANIDISETLTGALPVYLLIVLGLCLVIMLLVFRSIWVPVMATLGFVLSTLASFGAVVMVYQLGWGASVFGVHHPGPILAFLPILLVGVLFGLSVDYQIFIVSGMREAYMKGMEAHQAVRVGYRQGGTVVTACGVIMVSVFAGFIFAHVSVVRPMGFALAFGVAVDAFLIRTTFIPATMQLLGRHAWWLPRWLDRILPNVDVEGERLDERLAAQDRRRGNSLQIRP